jgi:hypothetical protein
MVASSRPAIMPFLHCSIQMLSPMPVRKFTDLQLQPGLIENPGGMDTQVRTRTHNSLLNINQCINTPMMHTHTRTSSMGFR